MKTVQDSAALVGFSTSDDAAVYRLNKTQAVVSTVDFFPPVVDDPYAFGAIAAANALSDVYAMGGRPLFALNLVGWPDDLPLKDLAKVMQGGQDKCAEAGVPVLGGHSVRDPEPKFGLAVTGVVDPRRVLTNAGAKAGDVLILTKPLGSGIATTAIKRGVASRALVKRAVALMSELNRPGGEVFGSGKFKVNALTDVTGFGLLGHLLEMMQGAKLRATLSLEHLPILAEVPALAAAGVVPGGTKANLAHVGKRVRFPEGLPADIQLVLADAQTNGGLLASVPARAALQALKALERAGVEGHLVGEVHRGKVGIDVV